MDMINPALILVNLFLTIYYGIINPSMPSHLLGTLRISHTNPFLAAVIISQGEALFHIALTYYLGNNLYITGYLALWTIIKTWPVAKNQLNYIFTAYSGLTSVGAVALMALAIQSNFVAG